MKLEHSFFVCLVMTLVAIPMVAAPLGTSMTYQGVLTDGGSPLTGVVDLRFRLYDAATGGTELGVVVVEDIALTGGRVSTELDFGDHFDGDARWLQIEVRDGASPGAYDPLPDRQPLLASPLGLYAGGAEHAVAATHATATVDAAALGGLTGADYRAFSNLTGVPVGLSDGDDDTAAGLACSPGEMPSWNGSFWVCDPDDVQSYARTAVVGPVGDAAANGAALIAALAALPIPTSREEGWLIELEPGLYDLGSSSLDLPPWVTLNGAGEIFTVITSAVCGAAYGVTATILGDDHVEIRDLTVENTCSSDTLRSRAVSFDGAHDAARMYRVTARTTGAAGGCIGVYNRSENSVLDRVTAEVVGCAGQSDAIFNLGLNALLTDCIATADGTSTNRGLVVSSRSFVNRGAFTATDMVGNADAAVVVEATADLVSIIASCPEVAVRVLSSHTYTVTLTRLTANGAVEAEDHDGTLRLIIEHSRIVAAGPTVIGDSGAAIGIAMTQLAGGPVSPSGGAIVCAGIWDEFWTPYATTCP